MKESIKKLPITVPEIKTYPAETYLMSVLPQNSASKNWIFSNYINLYGYITPEHWIYQAYTLDDFRLTCPLIEISRFTSDTFITQKWGNIYSFFKDCIDAGYYIIPQYEQFYCPLSSNFQVGHRIHDMIIYGYNDSVKSFYIGDFFDMRGFLFKELSFELTDKCIQYVPKEKFRIDIFKSRDSYCYNFNLNFVIKTLREYLLSIHTVEPYEERMLTVEEKLRFSLNGYTYGIKNYDLLNSAILYAIENRAFLSKEKVISGIVSRLRRSAHVMYCHKALMLDRLNYLKDNHFISKSYPEYKELRNQCLINRNLIMKNSRPLNSEAFQKILENYSSIKKEEVSILEDVLNELSQNFDM